jgi:eukaryotic-like serine/threonine-protein kinase
MVDLVGQTLGQYRIESVIGSGGMGQVYRGIHVILNRPAAVKVMSQRVAADTSFQDRFKREARSAAALDHPNIVKVYDFGEEHSLYYLVMELVPDGSLRTLLRRGAAGAPPSLTMLLTLVHQAAEAIGYAQTQGMVHRDIKPDNLLLQRETPPPGGSETFALKIADFGLARMTEGDGLTVTGAILGTPAYMSPEQCLGNPLDGRSDLYSLGVVLYEAATGFQPFKAANATEVMFKQVNTLPTPPLEVKPDLPAGLDEVILRCLAKKPDDRFQNGADLAQALGPFAGGKPFAARAAAVRTRPSTQPRRTAPPAAAVAATPADGTRMEAGAPGATPAPKVPPPLPGIAAPHVRIVDAAGAVVRDVELGAGELTIGRQPDNNVVLDGDGVSRHHAVVTWNNSAVTIADVNSANGTLLAGVRLLPRDPQRWSAGDTVRIGPYWLVLDLPGGGTTQPGRLDRETMRTASTGPAWDDGGAAALMRNPAAAPVAVGTQPKPDAPNRIAVTLDQDVLTITPGQVTTCKVTVANSGALVDHLTIQVEGVPPDWIQQPDPTVHLNPGAQSTVVLTVNVERSPRNRAGTYPATVRALSRENPGESGAASARWTVLPFYADALALRPTRARGRGRAGYAVALSNNGNIPSQMQLKGEDDEEKLGYQFSPQPAVVVDAGATSVVGLTVTDKRILAGNPQPPYPFAVKAQSSGGGQSTNGQFVNVPLLPAWVPSRAVMVAALAAAVVVYAVALRPNLPPPLGSHTAVMPTATATKAPTVGPTGPLTCADASGFNGAQPASPINGFGFAFPVNTVDLLQPHTETNSYLFEQVNLCTANIDAGGLRTAYTSLFVGSGWQQSGNFPYQGNPNRGCGDPYCWMKGTSPQPTLFASLQGVRHNGQVTTYNLLLAIAPYTSSASLQPTSQPPGQAANSAALAPSSSTYDVVLVQDANGLSLQPQNGAAIAVLETGASDLNGITYDQLRGASYGAASPDTSFTTGTVYAVRLSSGLYAKVLVTDATAAPYSIAWVLYQQSF